MSVQRSFTIRTSTCAGILAVLALSAGCTTVQPWERGNLADYAMQSDRDALHVTMTEHIHFSREASTGGRGVGGGGCGCN